MASRDLAVAQILHGEQYLEVYKPLTPNANITSRATIADVLDKGRGALIIVNSKHSFCDNANMCLCVFNNGLRIVYDRLLLCFIYVNCPLYESCIRFLLVYHRFFTVYIRTSSYTLRVVLPHFHLQ